MLKPSAHVVQGLVQVLLRYVIRKLRDLAGGCGSRASGLVFGALGLASGAVEPDRAATPSAAITVEVAGKRASADTATRVVPKYFMNESSVIPARMAV